MIVFFWRKAVTGGRGLPHGFAMRAGRRTQGTDFRQDELHFYILHTEAALKKYVCLFRY